MANQMSKSLITISKGTIFKKGGVVILPLKEYQKLRERAVPIYHLTGKEAQTLDRLAEKGLRDHKLGKTRKIKSLSDLG